MQEEPNIKHWPAGTWFQKRMAEVKMREATETLEKEDKDGSGSRESDND